jgi:hypothetical protein
VSRRAAPQPAAAADPDRLAALEEERDFLLRSLDDLDAEHAAGDLDDLDHRALRDDYTARAAAVIRAIDDQRAALAAAPRRSARFFVVGAALVAVFAVVAGFALAGAAGQRVPGGVITGSIDSPRARVLECQQLAGQSEGLLEGIRCLDEVLVADPVNAEALTYRGWYLVLAWRSSGGASEADELLSAGVGYLDRALALPEPTLVDAHAFRAIAADWSGDPATACDQLDELSARSVPPMVEQLTTPLAERLSC